jgi:long-subunit fatty acid transport protein
MRKIGPVVAVLLAVASAASAQDFQVGSRAKGMGGSYTAFDEDPVSIWMNPAGIAGAPSRLAIDYQSFTQYEIQDTGLGLGSVGEPEFGMIDPPIIPSFIGFTTPIHQSETETFQFGIAMVRPFQNRLSYVNGAVIIQTEQQFSRFRFAGAYEHRAAEGKGFFHSLAGGLGLDIGFSAYEESDNAGALDRRDTDTRFGFGLGFQAGVYTNQEDFQVDFGLAFQSSIDFEFQIDDQFFPVWDWPTMISGGFVVKLLDKMDLRLTFDAQYILWDEATQDDLTGANEDFQDALNFSFGVEYYVRVNETVSLLPRVGVRFYDAPWDDEDQLPAIGLNVLSIDTDDEAFVIFTLGFSLQWLGEGNRVRAFDVGLEFGGDSPNFSFGYRHDF